MQKKQILSYMLSRQYFEMGLYNKSIRLYSEEEFWIRESGCPYWYTYIYDPGHDGRDYKNYILIFSRHKSVKKFLKQKIEFEKSFELLHYSIDIENEEVHILLKESPSGGFKGYRFLVYSSKGDKLMESRLKDGLGKELPQNRFKKTDVIRIQKSKSRSMYSFFTPESNGYLDLLVLYGDVLCSFENWDFEKEFLDFDFKGDGIITLLSSKKILPNIRTDREIINDQEYAKQEVYLDFYFRDNESKRNNYLNCVSRRLPQGGYKFRKIYCTIGKGALDFRMIQSTDNCYSMNLDCIIVDENLLQYVYKLET